MILLLLYLVQYTCVYQLLKYMYIHLTKLKHLYVYSELL